MTALVAAGLPPGPAAPPPIQTLRQLRDPYGFLLGCHHRHGDVFTVRLIPCGTMVYVADPELVRELFARPLRGGAVNAYMTPLLGRGLLTLDGREHAAHRAVLAPLLSAHRIGAHVAMIIDETAREIAGWPDGELALRPRLDGLALRVMRRILFGQAGVELDRLITDLKRRSVVEHAASLAAHKLGLPSRAARIVARIDDVVMRAIADRRADPFGEDVLGALVTTELVDREIRDELLTLLFAGHETVATTLAWLFERVTRHPDVLARLASADDAYLEAVIKETMRARSCLADVGRTLDAPTTLGRWHLPAGAQVFPAIVPIHMRADRYPDPDLFRPERFLEGQPEPWAFLPFGGGARRCIGAALAMLEMRTIAREIARRCRIAPSTREPEHAVGNGMTIAPHLGAVVRLERA